MNIGLSDNKEDKYRRFINLSILNTTITKQLPDLYHLLDNYKKQKKLA